MSDAQLQHDPRTKSNIKELLYHYLYDPIEKKLDEEIKALVIANAKALKSSQRGFVYRNHWYTTEPDKPAPRRKDRLIPALKSRMDEYLAEVTTLNTQELPYVMGFINQVLNSSDDLQDYFQVFPESLHEPLQTMIGSCPCRMTRLAPETAQEMRERNAHPIQLIQSRLVLNLLIQ